MTVKEFFEKVREGQLSAIRCTACNALAVPPKEFCPACGKRSWTALTLAGNGTVASYTVIRVAPRQFASEAPYALAQVRLTEGVSILGRLVDVPLDKLSIGLPVKFRPLLRGDQASVSFVPA
jgi:3-oxo-4,17-pregnadiene-20-carboxyl-CoA hydratase alpha subunit